jgi:DNA-binding transcriptional LysR family regulator
MRLDQLNGLLAFVTVAEKRGFSAASRTLGLSPSALSQSVRALEARVGTALLIRTTRAVSLTEAGASLLRRCAPALREAMSALEDAAPSNDEVVGTLRCSVPQISLPFIEALLLELHTRHPRLHIEVLVDDKFVDLVRDGFDVGIRLFEATEKDMVALRVAPPFRFVVVGSPSYLKQRGCPEHPRDLGDHDCIGFREMSTGALYQWEFERKGRDFKVAVQGPLITNDAGMMVRAATLGFGLAYVPDFSAAPQLRTKVLKTLLDDFTPKAPGLFLYFPQVAKQQPKIRAVVRAIRGTRRPDQGQLEMCRG